MRIRLLFPAALAAALGACDGAGNVRRDIEVVHGAGAPDAQAVAKSVAEFGASRSFVCRERPAPVVLECESYGPRTLTVEARGNSSVAQLDQSYPLTVAGAPRLFEETRDAFTRYMAGRFGASAQVVK